ncbi:protein PIGBOS1 [Hyperolius riggenbachi]|uniref:protein PIGBOS1 n=1 Tax=Hyperolius riggenbachi TaxID=752182 RepID=UPI0035A2CCF2
MRSRTIASPEGAVDLKPGCQLPCGCHVTSVLLICDLKEGGISAKMRRRLPFSQLLLAVLVGVAGGVYIYRPLFEQYLYEHKPLQTDSDVTKIAENDNK